MASRGVIHIWYVYTWIGYLFRRRSSAGIQDDLLDLIFARQFIIPGILVPFFLMLILGVAICVKVCNHRKRFSTFFSVKIRIGNDVKTARTIGVTVLAYFCMNVIPMLLHNLMRRRGSWTHFLAFFLMKLNSMVNPIIYALKTPR